MLLYRCIIASVIQAIQVIRTLRVLGCLVCLALAIAFVCVYGTIDCVYQMAILHCDNLWFLACLTLAQLSLPVFV